MLDYSGYSADVFNVFEGNTATVNVLGELTTNLNGTLPGVESDAALSSEGGIDLSPDYKLTVVGFSDPTTGGFITSVPEPSNLYSIAVSGMILLLMRSFQSRRG